MNFCFVDISQPSLYHVDVRHETSKGCVVVERIVDRAMMRSQCACDVESLGCDPNVPDLESLGGGDLQ